MNDRPRTKLSSQFGRELVWVRPQMFQREHRLMAGNETIAIMQFRGFQSAFAVTATGQWIIQRRGLFRIGADMRESSGLPVLAIRTGFLKKWADLPDGRTFRWLGYGFLALNHELVNDREQRLLRCAHSGPFSRKRGTLELLPAGVSHPLLDPLALASWYLVTRLRQRRAAHGGG